MAIDPEILCRIPHRPPFLWIDTIDEQGDDYIVTRKTIPEDLDVFRGHYPHHPIMPGVLLCEAIFQSGALLMSYKLERESQADQPLIPVLTRIGGAKFKRSVEPGDIFEIRVELKEAIASVSIMKGTLRVHGKIAVQVDFSCALITE